MNWAPPGSAVYTAHRGSMLAEAHSGMSPVLREGTGAIMKLAAEERAAKEEAEANGDN